MKRKVILVSDITNRILTLESAIQHEKNTKEKARLVDEQAALKLVVRLLPQQTATLT